MDEQSKRRNWLRFFDGLPPITSTEQSVWRDGFFFGVLAGFWAGCFTFALVLLVVLHV